MDYAIDAFNDECFAKESRLQKPVTKARKRQRNKDDKKLSY